MSNCIICGHDKFGLGPGGRSAANGTPPRCEKCQSLERHRAIRYFFTQIVDSSFKDKNILQFSEDRSINSDGFNNYEVSCFDGPKSLDLQKIDRETNQYDMVICNHVLEHVRYDNAALNELTRITNPDGMCFLTFPDPVRNERTRDWDYPDESQHGHYRIYGADVENRFSRYIPNAYVLRVKLLDEVTMTEDCAFLLSKKQNSLLEKIEASSLVTRRVQ